MSVHSIWGCSQHLTSDKNQEYKQRETASLALSSCCKSSPGINLPLRGHESSLLKGKLWLQIYIFHLCILDIPIHAKHQLCEHTQGRSCVNCVFTKEGRFYLPLIVINEPIFFVNSFKCYYRTFWRFEYNYIKMLNWICLMLFIKVYLEVYNDASSSFVLAPVYHIRLNVW